jgi:hypothetical protein
MQATTFGSFPAAQILADKLDKLGDPTVTKKVSRLLQDLNTGLSHIEKISDPLYRGRLALLWRDDFLAKLAILPDVDKFLSNVIITNTKPLLTNDEAE